MWVCSAFEESTHPMCLVMSTRVTSSQLGSIWICWRPWDEDVGCLRSGGLQRGLWSLFWPWPCLGLCAVALPARTQGWGRGTAGGKALGAGLQAADLCVLGRRGSQLNGWRMGRRAPGRDVTREGFFHTVAKVIIVLRRRADPDVGLRLLQDGIGGSEGS